jgi:hypothetical protein
MEGTLSKEVTAMISTVDETRVVSAPETTPVAEVSDGMRIARYCALDELPGLVFAVMTLAYIVLSLAGLTL